MKILVFYKYFFPGVAAGGPLASLKNLFLQLGDAIDFSLVTTNSDAEIGGSDYNVKPRIWYSLFGAKVMYCSRGSINIRTLVALVKTESPGAIYLNSCFDPIFTLRILVARRLGLLSGYKIILQPRGELHAGSLSHKPLKKRVFLKVANLLGLYRGLIWQASSPLEKADIQREFQFVDDSRVSVAPDLVAPPTEAPRLTTRNSDDALRVCFLSRISPTKNLDFALKILQKVREPICFSVYGHREFPDYFEFCRTLAEKLPTHVACRFLGPLPNEQVIEKLSEHDVFFFPTKGENYGHVIYEALSAALPVLTSDRVPWHEAEKDGVLWRYSLMAETDFVEGLEKLASMPADKLKLLRQRAFAFAEAFSCDSAAKTASLKLFIE